MKILLICGLFALLAGCICNIIVFNANNGAMPVNVPTQEITNGNGLNSNPHISSLDNQVKFKVLSDIIVIGSYSFSIGDILMIMGFLLSGISGITLALRYEQKHGFLKRT